MPRAPFPIQAALTAIAIAYKNLKLIADEVLPRISVGKQEFKYLKHTMAEGFTVPDTKVGRKSKPNQIDFSASEVTSATEDYGLDDAIPQSDIDNAPPNYNPLGKATEGIMNLIELDREVRTAGLIFTDTNYPAGNIETLSGTDQFNDFSNSSPIEVITDALDSMIMRATIMVIGRPAFTKLSQHPDVVKAMLGNSGDKGIATRQAIAALFELDDVLVGEAFVNTARKGQAASLARTWGKHIALLHRDKTASTQGGATFGLTAQWGGRISGSIPDKDIGLRGGQRVRAGESVKELITASDLGYFIKDVVA